MSNKKPQSKNQEKSEGKKVMTKLEAILLVAEKNAIKQIQKGRDIVSVDIWRGRSYKFGILAFQNDSKIAVTPYISNQSGKKRIYVNNSSAIQELLKIAVALDKISDFIDTRYSNTVKESTTVDLTQLVEETEEQEQEDIEEETEEEEQEEVVEEESNENKKSKSVRDILGD